MNQSKKCTCKSGIRGKDCFDYHGEQSKKKRKKAWVGYVHEFENFLDEDENFRLAAYVKKDEQYNFTKKIRITIEEL